MQFIPSLERAGIELYISPLLDDEYLERKFATGQTSPTAVARGYLARIRALVKLRDYDLAVVQYELFPFVPYGIESLLRGSGVPYIYDLDDAIFHLYDQHRSGLVRRLMEGKIPAIVAAASHVLAGSEYLAKFARRHSDSVELLPTVVDTGRYTPRVVPRSGGLFRVGWMGSPSTASYLKDSIPPLSPFFNGGKARFIAVGGGLLKFSGIPTESRDWNLEAEVDDLRDFDVGIMPLRDDPWARGKCGYKLIQYMACGLPVIASPVGANSDIVEHGVNGFLATSPGEWIEALKILEVDPALRRALGDAGRRKVESRYSLSYAAPLFAAALQRVLNRELPISRIS